MGGDADSQIADLSAMGRAKTILQSEFPYHTAGRCINQEWFNLPMDFVWEVMTRQLYYIHHVYDARIHLFVLMSNHFHLLLSTPLCNIDLIMWNFMLETSRALTAAGNRINQTYGGPHFRSVINTQDYFETVYKYCYRNPVEAGIVDRPELYKFSTLNGLLGASHLSIPVQEDSTLFPDLENCLEWLNTPPEEKHRLAVKAALKKSTFELAKDPNTKRKMTFRY